MPTVFNRYKQRTTGGAAAAYDRNEDWRPTVGSVRFGFVMALFFFVGERGYREKRIAAL